MRIKERELFNQKYKEEKEKIEKERDTLINLVKRNTDNVQKLIEKYIKINIFPIQYVDVSMKIIFKDIQVEEFIEEKKIEVINEDVNPIQSELINENIKLYEEKIKKYENELNDVKKDFDSLNENFIIYL